MKKGWIYVLEEDLRREVVCLHHDILVEDHGGR